MQLNSRKLVKEVFTIAEGSVRHNTSQVNCNSLLSCNAKSTVQEIVRQWRADGFSVALVPTMGALHEGHLDLVRLACARADRVAASIFVNPVQFAPHEDFDAYPRTREADLEMLAGAGAHLAYCPRPGDMYPGGPEASTRVFVPGIGDPLEGQHRPHFFGGVATVVARLFIHVAPDIAIFGEKDFQQLSVIRRMTADLGFPIEIVGAPTRREPDGLAMSSRNRYLSATERQSAGAMFAALHRAAARLAVGASVADIVAEGEASLSAAGFRDVDYFAACDPETLAALPPGPVAPGTTGRLLAAAWMGRTRLIDNVGFTRP